MPLHQAHSFSRSLIAKLTLSHQYKMENGFRYLHQTMFPICPGKIFLTHSTEITTANAMKKKKHETARAKKHGKQIDKNQN